MYEEHKLSFSKREKPKIFYDWASISQANRKDGHLTKEGEILLQELAMSEFSKEVKKTELIEKENEKLTKLVNVMKDKFIALKRKHYET